MTSCSFPRQVKEGAEGSGEGFESSGQSKIRSIVLDLIALGPPESDSEGERLVDDHMNPSFISMSFSEMEKKLLSRYQETSNTNHWLPKVFRESSLSSLTILKENSDRSSACFGEHVPDAKAKLAVEAYVEFRFQNDRFIVRLYYQPYGHRSRILCRTNGPARDKKDSWMSLVALTISRRGSFLNLVLNDGVEEPPGLWACIKFPEYESTFIRA